MHKHQYTAPSDLFMQFRDKDRRSPAQAQVTEQLGGIIPVNMRTEGGYGNRPTLNSLNEVMASAGTNARRQAAIRRAWGY